MSSPRGTYPRQRRYRYEYNKTLSNSEDKTDTQISSSSKLEKHQPEGFQPVPMNIDSNPNPDVCFTTMVTTSKTPTEYRSRTTYTSNMLPGFKNSNPDQNYPIDETGQSNNFELDNDFLCMRSRLPLSTFEHVNNSAFYSNDIRRNSMGDPTLSQSKTNASVNSNHNNFTSTDIRLHQKGFSEVSHIPLKKKRDRRRSRFRSKFVRDRFNRSTHRHHAQKKREYGPQRQIKSKEEIISKYNNQEVSLSKVDSRGNPQNTAKETPEQKNDDGSEQHRRKRSRHIYHSRMPYAKRRELKAKIKDNEIAKEKLLEETQIKIHEIEAEKKNLYNQLQTPISSATTNRSQGNSLERQSTKNSALYFTPYPVDSHIGRSRPSTLYETSSPLEQNHTPFSYSDVRFNLQYDKRLSYSTKEGKQEHHFGVDYNIRPFQDSSQNSPFRYSSHQKRQISREEPRKDDFRGEHRKAYNYYDRYDHEGDRGDTYILRNENNKRRRSTSIINYDYVPLNSPIRSRDYEQRHHKRAPSISLSYSPYYSSPRRTCYSSYPYSSGEPNKSPVKSKSQKEDEKSGHFEGGPGTIIHDGRYEIIREMGKGTFGRVVLCKDLNCDISHGRKEYSPKYVAIKIVRSVSRYTKSAKIEADLLKLVNKKQNEMRHKFLSLGYCPEDFNDGHIVSMIDEFELDSSTIQLPSSSGKNNARSNALERDRGGKLYGKEGQIHYCLVFEKLGLSLYDFIKRNHYKPLPLKLVQSFSLQLLEAVHFLHSKVNMVHTDLKLENILLVNDGYRYDFEDVRIARRARYLKRRRDLEEPGNMNDRRGKTKGTEHALIHHYIFDLSDSDNDYEIERSKGNEDRDNSSDDSSFCSLLPVENQETKTGQIIIPSSERKKRRKLHNELYRKSKYGKIPLFESANKGELQGYEEKFSTKNTVPQKDSTKDENQSKGHHDTNNSTDINDIATRTNLIKVIDLGGATLHDDEFKARIINTRQYRSPEVTLEIGTEKDGPQWSFASDLWSVGCIIVELYTGELLFGTRDSVEHMAMIERCCGRFPRWMTGKENAPVKNPINKVSRLSTKNSYITDRYEYTADIEPNFYNPNQHSKGYEELSNFDKTKLGPSPNFSNWKIEREVASRFFDENGLISYRYLSNSSIDYVRQTPPIKKVFSNDRDTGIIELVEGLLTIDPQKRLTAEEALKMPFFQKNL